jgi:arginyl-tRNA synthetase
MIKEEIREAIQKALASMEISVESISIDYPADPEHGDYATNVALVAAKKVGKNPRALAEEIIQKMQNSELFDRLEVAGPGFINMWIKNEKFAKVIDLLRYDKTFFDSLAKIGSGKKVIVEYSSPNIAKPFTIGHLRSTIIGDASANLLKAVGYEVFRDNHIGDWGTQFGKQIYAIKEWGDEKKIEKSEQPVKDLVALYVKFHDEAEKDPSLEDKAREWFKKLEDGDQEARNLWGDCIKWSWKEFNAIYKQLGVSFTENDGRGYGEAFFEDKMQPILKELKEKNLLQEGKEGAKIVEFPEETKLPQLMILKKDGATLYSTRDLATDKFRIEQYGKDITIINEVGIEQSLYFQQLYKLEEMLGWFKKEQRVHVKHGHYRFKEGKMSTRKGNVIWLEDVLKEALDRASKLQNIEFAKDLKKIREVGDNVINKKSGAAGKIQIKINEEIDLIPAIGIGALKWNDLKRDSKQDINFDWDEILNMQGNSGPYMQYAYVRTRSVLEKAGKFNTNFHLAEDFKLKEEERELLRLLIRFPDIVAEAAQRYAPHLVCTYLFDLAQAFNLFYQKLPILKAEAEERDVRLHMTESTGVVLKCGLDLLGIHAPQKM